MKKISYYDKQFPVNLSNSMKSNSYTVKKTRASRLGDTFKRHRASNDALVIQEIYARTLSQNTD